MAIIQIGEPIKQKASQGGRVMRQEREKESLEKAKSGKTIDNSKLGLPINKDY